HGPAAVHQQRVAPQRGPIVGPRCHVEREGVTLIEVELSAAPHGGVPRRGRRRHMPAAAGVRGGSCGRGQGQEFSSIHGIPYRASGSGRSWNLSTLLVVPLPPSM